MGERYRERKRNRERERENERVHHHNTPSFRPFRNGIKKSLISFQQRASIAAARSARAHTHTHRGRFLNVSRKRGKPSARTSEQLAEKTGRTEAGRAERR